MIRNRIVVGVRDNSMAERLQIDPELTLKTNLPALQDKVKC